MANNYALIEAELEQLDFREAKIRDTLLQFASSEQRSIDLEGLSESISRQLELEEKTMENIGLSLTPIHQNEHKNLLKEIILLEFSWKAKRISDDVYIKSINYKLDFHAQYFDRTQRLLLAGKIMD